MDCDYSPLDVYVSPYSAGILTGLTAALATHGLPADPALVQVESWTPLAVDAALLQLQALADPPTALFAAP